MRRPRWKNLSLSERVRSAALIHERVGEHLVRLRPTRREDIDAFVAYWHGGLADLAHLGIDPAKLGTEQDTRRRFEQLLDGPHPRPALGFTITVDDHVVGFININVLGRQHGTPHFHLIDPSARRGDVMSTVLRAGLPKILQAVREHTNADGLVIEVRTRNHGMNQVRQRLGYDVVDTRELNDPDGLAGPGTFNIYRIGGA